jgi:hypothetical protein
VIELIAAVSTFWVLWVSDMSGRYKAPHSTYPTKALCSKQIDKVAKDLRKRNLGEFKIWCGPPYRYKHR